ncbi:restriction endonuclease [Blastococcus sp. SYSU DS1024]
MPADRLIRSPRDAELSAAAWMSHFGYSNVTVTPVGPDEGIDVISDEALCQVKAETAPTGLPVVQRHFGVCQAHRKDSIFFSLAGYTPKAAAWADIQEMALFRFDLQGRPEAYNHAAREIWSSD